MSEHHESGYRLSSSAYGKWIAETCDWSHYGTFTFRPYTPPPDPGLGPPKHSLTDAGPSEEAAFKAWDRYVRSVSGSAHRRIGWLAALEAGPLYGRLHIHALLCDADCVSPERAGRLWIAGWSKVERYDTHRGAAHYVAKFAGEEIGYWDVGGTVVDRARRVR